jgi:hypothetical protein
MSKLTRQELFQIYELFDLDEHNDYNFFVETGTYQGETILSMYPYFEKSFTIELSEKFYSEFNKKDYDNTKLQSLFGDSSTVIKEVIPNLNNKTIFFLDGHYSSCGTAKGVKDVPLYEELESINNFFPYECIIIIDDLRLFGTNLSEDWSEIDAKKIINLLDSRLIKHIEINDRLVIKLKNIEK